MGSRVYIGRLSYRANDKDVEKFFKGYGKLLDISLKNGFGFIEFNDYRDAEDAVYELNGKDLCGERVTLEHSKGYPHGRDQQRLYDVMERHGKKYDREKDQEKDRIARERIREKRDSGGHDRYNNTGKDSSRDRYYESRRRSSSGQRKSGGGYRVIIENLSSRVTWQDLKDYMQQAGEVVFADAHNNRKNEGIVEFESYEGVKKALDKLDGTDINGREIKIREEKKQKRSRSPLSRSRSRSRHGSRPRSRSK